MSSLYFQSSPGNLEFVGVRLWLALASISTVLPKTNATTYNVLKTSYQTASMQKALAISSTHMRQ